MGKRENYRDRIAPELGTAVGRARLERLLADESNLPGPRGNLELAAGFADACVRAGGDVVGWLHGLAAIGPEAAGGDQPRLMLPFAATIALGGIAPETTRARAALDAALARAADDPRWRMREGVAMALQRLGLRDPAHLRGLLETWTATPTPLRLRAALAALADPPLLASDEGLARLGLEIADLAFAHLAALDARARRAEDAVALAKGLAFAPSLFVEKLPRPGFALLRRWAKRGDTAINKAIASNLGKARLQKHAADCEAVREVLESEPGAARRRRQAP